MTIPTDLHGQHGFSLIEALVALAILMVGFLALGQFQSAAIQGNAQVRNRSLALSLAEARMEAMRGQAYASLASDSNTVTGPNAAFNVAWSVNNLTGPERRELTVTVTWTTSEGKDREVELSSWVAPSESDDVGLIPTS